VPEIRQLLEVMLPVERWNAATAIAWYEHQQRRKAAARASHTKRWLREHPVWPQPALCPAGALIHNAR
jgi:hypothetical protein